MASVGEGNVRPSFALPHHNDFARLGVALKQELDGGYQSRVVLATEHDGVRSRDVVIKLIDVRGLDRAHVMERLRVRDRVARYDDRIIPIIPLAGARVHRVGDVLAFASPFIEGRQLEARHRPDVERMGRSLARLHQSLRLVTAELPPVAALRAGEPVEGMQENHQLLHGDFAPSNLMLDDDGFLWIFDFDEAGYGPVEFELGNTLFMTLFDTSPSAAAPSEDFHNFRKWFLGAYQASAEHAISELLVDLALKTRTEALRYWLGHLDEAPAGIRNSTPEWRCHLEAFVGAS